MATVATISICTNALFLQKGPHPAPIFATRPLVQPEAPMAPARATSAPPAAALAPEPLAQSREQLVANIQRELGRRGFYDGAVDGIWGAKTDAATRDFVQITGVKVNPEASDGLLHAILSSGAKTPTTRAAPAAPVRSDPIAELIAPSKRVLAIQRALTDFGYGQIKPTGIYDADTRVAIEKFERDHRLPITGQISDPVVRELAGMTGRLLE